MRVFHVCSTATLSRLPLHTSDTMCPLGMMLVSVFAEVPLWIPAKYFVYTSWWQH